MTGPEHELNLGLLLFIPYRFLESAVMATLRAHGHDLPLSEARVFQRIGPEGSRMSELAEAAQVTKQTLTSIVDRLELAGYVSRRPDPEDARARLVTITDKGRDLVDLSVPVVAAVEAAWERHLGRDHTEQLRRILTELREITDLPQPGSVAFGASQERMDRRRPRPD